MKDINTTIQYSYVCGFDYANATKGMDKLVEFLKNSTDAQPAAEIGKATFGERYTALDIHGRRNRCIIAHLSQMLRHLVDAGLIKAVKIDGEPVEVTHSKYIQGYTYDVPQYVEAYTATGEYMGKVLNPRWNSEAAWRASVSGHWADVTETITPKINAYIWVGEK